MSAQKVETKKITIDCPVKLLERIDRLAEFGDLPRQRLITNLMEVGVDYLETTKKVGVLHMTLLIRDFIESAKVHAKRMQNVEIKGLSS